MDELDGRVPGTRGPSGRAGQAAARSEREGKKKFAWEARHNSDGAPFVPPLTEQHFVSIYVLNTGTNAYCRAVPGYVIFPPAQSPVFGGKLECADSPRTCITSVLTPVPAAALPGVSFGLGCKTNDIITTAIYWRSERRMKP